MVADKQGNKSSSGTIQSYSNIKKKGHEKLKKYQRLNKELERMCGFKALIAGTPKLGEWLQQIPVITLEISAQRSTILLKTKILCRNLRILGLW